MTSTPITQSEFARRHGVSRQAVNDLISRGIIALTADRMIDEAVALEAITASRDPARVGKIISGPEIEMTVSDIPPPAAVQSGLPIPPTADEATSYHAAKTRREHALAKIAEIDLKIAELDYAEKRGLLIRAADIEPKIKGAVIAAREYLRAQPPRLAALLESKTKIERERLLRQTFDEFLTRLSDWRSGGIVEDDAET